MRHVAALFVALTLWGQIEQGSLVGIVSDPQKVPVVGAAVTFRSLTTNVQRQELTQSSGDFNSLPLPPGRYAVTVRQPGFREQTVEVRLESASDYRSISRWNSAASTSR